MAAPRYPTTQYLTGNFVISAGSILFRRVSTDTSKPANTSTASTSTKKITPTASSTLSAKATNTSTNKPAASTSTSTNLPPKTEEKPTKASLQICVLHQLKRNEWVLPKGRKDRGESLELAAVRETYEETGWKCRLWPQRMRTLATLPGGADDAVHRAQIADGLTEPIAITVRQLRQRPGIEGERTKMIFWYITQVEEGTTEKVEGSQMANECFESVFLGVDEAVGRLTFQTDRDLVQQAVDIVLGGGGS